MIVVKEVKTKKDRKKFVNLPLKMYKSNTYFVPPLYSDEMAFFTEKKFYEFIHDLIVNVFSSILKFFSHSFIRRF